MIENYAQEQFALMEKKSPEAIILKDKAEIIKELNNNINN